jgi:hypothetical protein
MEFLEQTRKFRKKAFEETEHSMKIKIASELMQYVAPKLRSLDVQGEIKQQSITVVLGVTPKAVDIVTSKREKCLLEPRNGSSTLQLSDAVSTCPLMRPSGLALARIAVTVIDPQAHMNKTILSAIAQIDFPKFAAQAQAGATVLIFPIDEVSDMEDISETVDTLGDSVDWVIVKNRERIPTTKFFDGSALEKELQGYKAAYLDLPPLLTDTRNHLRGSQLRLGRTLSPAEAISNPSLEIDAVHRILFQKWVADVFRRLDAIKSYLVPDDYADEIQPHAEAKTDKARRTAAGINRRMKGRIE